MSDVSGSTVLSPVPLEEDAECHLTTAPVVDANTSFGRPAATEGQRVLWGYLAAVVILHLLLPLVFVPWLFSWTALALAPVAHYFFTSLGIGAGYHRLLTHRSYRCPRWLEHTFALFGVCALQDSPARWVVIHRIHHQHSDHQPDPHTPIVSFFWGHMGWLFVSNKQVDSLSGFEKYAKDLLKDPFYMKLERRMMWIWVYLAHALVIYLVGSTIQWAITGDLMQGVQFGLSLVVYTVILRTVFGWHVTWGVNSAAHRFGYRNYDTDENSRNNWLFALLTNGDGWHNNHHADPRSAAHGFHRWWEIDVTYMTLKLLSYVGLVTDIIPPRRQMKQH